LLDSATQVFSRRGYHEASLGEISAGAGVSTGAIYSSFAGKDDLFLTLVEREISAEVEAFVAGTTGAEEPAQRLARAAEQYMGFVRREPGLFLLSMEFWARAVRDPGLRERYNEHRARRTSLLAALIATSIDEYAIDSPLEPRAIAVAIEALADGVTMRWLAAPDEVPDELFGLMLGYALRGLMAPG
jgi:AcrR family transcriptional regulator